MYKNILRFLVLGGSIVFVSACNKGNSQNSASKTVAEDKKGDQETNDTKGIVGSNRTRTDVGTVDSNGTVTAEPVDSNGTVTAEPVDSNGTIIAQPVDSRPSKSSTEDVTEMGSNSDNNGTIEPSSNSSILQWMGNMLKKTFPGLW